ncbi:jg25132 [Pararge aegeria aegeria]|uniref:Jg25132 protein n=1 Tax=Pararge aegeria aegeria TaxID=348720 RepID=A0A8S4SG98_9NEOP|nr:jg25132 [Pararge aegeria aegeria]
MPWSKILCTPLAVTSHKPDKQKLRNRKFPNCPCWESNPGPSHLKPQYSRPCQEARYTRLNQNSKGFYIKSALCSAANVAKCRSIPETQDLETKQWCTAWGR